MKNYTHISHDHYYVTDAEAGRLARPHRLPKHGYELKVALDDDLGLGDAGWLKRTELSYFARSSRDRANAAPKRGWVWCVMPTKG